MKNSIFLIVSGCIATLPLAGKEPVKIPIKKGKKAPQLHFPSTLSKGKWLDQYSPEVIRLCKGAASCEIDNDYKKAAEFYKQAADQDSAQANYKLGFFYENGLGVEKDNSIAAEFYQKAADFGITQAQYQLGLFYIYGDGIPQDYAKAVPLLLQVAEGKDAQSTHAQYLAGFLHEKGLGTKQNYAKASELYVTAADNGSSEAKLRLSLFLARGINIDKNLQEAEKLLESALLTLDIPYADALIFYASHPPAAQHYPVTIDKIDKALAAYSDRSKFLLGILYGLKLIKGDMGAQLFIDLQKKRTDSDELPEKDIEQFIHNII